MDFEREGHNLLYHIALKNAQYLLRLEDILPPIQRQLLMLMDWHLWW